MTNELLKKRIKVDLFLSYVSEKLLTDEINGSKTSTVTIPTYFTKDEVNEILKGVKYFNRIRNVVYTKEEGFKPLHSYSTKIERTSDKLLNSDKFNLVVTVL